MLEDVFGSVAVITGGGSGIGRGMARCFAKAGMHIVVSDVDLASAEAVADELTAAGRQAIAIGTDVSDLEAVRRLADAAFERFGEVNLLCNNAGVSLARWGIHATHQDWQWMLGVNLWGVIHGIECFLPRMLAQNSPGHIVNTASINGILPSMSSAMYSAGKYGVIGLTEVLRNELVDTQVGISAFCPAGVRSDIMKSERNRPPHLAAPTPPPPHVRSWHMNFSPPLDPEEAAEIVWNGVQKNQLHIFTDPLMRAMVEEHHARMKSEFDVLDEWRAQQS